MCAKSIQLLYDKNNWMVCQCVSSCNFDDATVWVQRSQPSSRPVCSETFWSRKKDCLFAERYAKVKWQINWSHVFCSHKTPVADSAVRWRRAFTNGFLMQIHAYVQFSQNPHVETTLERKVRDVFECTPFFRECMSSFWLKSSRSIGESERNFRARWTFSLVHRKRFSSMLREWLNLGCGHLSGSCSHHQFQILPVHDESNQVCQQARLFTKIVFDHAVFSVPPASSGRVCVRVCMCVCAGVRSMDSTGHISTLDMAWCLPSSTPILGVGLRLGATWGMTRCHHLFSPWTHRKTASGHTGLGDTIG